MATAVLAPAPDAPHPSGSDQFAIYTVAPDGSRTRVAETSLEGIGLTLVTLSGEGHFHGPDERVLPVGIFDRLTRVWITNPWARGPR